MKAKDVTLTLTTPAANALCLSQTPAGAGALTLNGTLTSGGALSLSTAHLFSITSAADISNRTFLVTGTDADGIAQTETITGPNATTVTSTKYFKTVSSITISGLAAGALTVGVTSGALSATINMAKGYIFTPMVGLQLDVGGTIDTTLQHTMQELDVGATSFTKTWLNHDVLVNVLADVTDNYAVPVSAMRVKVNSYTAGATLKLSYVQG